MSEKYNLINKQVNIYCTGGWNFIGKVEFISLEILVLDDGMDKMVLYRDKIVGAMILDDKKIEEIKEPVKEPQYQPKSKVAASEPLDLMENIYGGAYGSIIPNDMLEGEDDRPQVDFAIQMSSLRQLDNEGVSLGSNKETKINRKRNSG